MPVYHKEDPSTIQSMFNSIAKQYDKANGILSFQLHKKWNHTLICQVMSYLPSHTYLDLCSGTGDIAFDYLKSNPAICQAFLVDFSREMLNCAKAKAINLNLTRHAIEYIEADVQHIPLANESVDCATMAYGIRNVKDPLLCMQEVYRVLKPGGRFGILELTQPSSAFLRFGHQLYLKTILPFLGKMVTTNQDAYNYLQDSIRRFIAPQKLEEMMQQCGFTHTSRLSLTGGIATILIGSKE